MKRIFAVVFVLIVLAAFTPLGCFAEIFPCAEEATVCTLHEGEYQLDGSPSLNVPINLDGDVTLDLNGQSLNTHSIECQGSQCSLTITDNSSEKNGNLNAAHYIHIIGKLTVKSGNVKAGSILSGTTSNIEISGGTVTATGDSESGILAGGNITISGGMVTATGVDYGIRAMSSINIIGGTVTATGDHGIYAGSGNITISGGTVDAVGDYYGINTGENITISGEQTRVTAEATGTSFYAYRAGIYASGKIDIQDGTVNAAGVSESGIYAHGSITISGGTVTATGDHGIYAGSGNITISGGTVEAAGYYYGINTGENITISGEQTRVTAETTGTSFYAYRAGIYASGKIDIQDGTVNAAGSEFGISSFTLSADTGIPIGGDITISGGTVEADGDQSGIYSGGGSVTIEGGMVTATGVVDGINGGYVTISGGRVEATGEDYGIFAPSSIQINSGTVEATGNKAGICSITRSINDKVIDGHVTISGGTVKATGIGRDGIISSTVAISGGKVTATGDIGISGNVINISDGEVIATGRFSAIHVEYSIKDSDIDIDIPVSISISGGTVEATGGIRADVNGTGSGSITGGDITISGGTVDVTTEEYGYGIQSEIGDIAISGGQVSVNSNISAKNIFLGLAGPDDFIHAKSYSGTIKATTPLRVFDTEEMTGEPLDTIWADDEVPVDSNTINNMWLGPLKFTVTLDQTDATTTGTPSITATYGSAMPTADMPARTGYTFGGYFTEINGSGTQYYDGNGTSAKNWDKTEGGTLYAKWTANAYTAVFEANYPANTADADHSGSMQNQNFTYDEAEKQLTANGFSCVGYTFAGWNTDKNGSGKKYEDQQSVRNLTEEANGAFTLYGQWTAVEYTITIEPAENGSVASAPSGKAAYGETVTLTAAADAGYILETLNVKSGDTAVPVTDNKFTMPAGDVTVKASFVPHNHEYSFTASGAELTAECANTDGAHVGELKAALTLIPPEYTVYDGTAKTASVIGTIPDIAEPAIVYKQGTDVLDTAPVNAGTYTAEITLGDAAASAEFTITKRSVTVTAAAEDKVYDGTVKAVLKGTPVLNGIAEGDDVSVSVGKAEFEDPSAGQDKTVTFSGFSLSGADKDNYELSGQHADATASITKRSVTVTAVDQTIKKGEDIQTGPEWAELEGEVEGNVLSAVTLTAYGTQIRPSDAKIA